MAPSDFGPKMKMMEQKAFWMRMKTFSTFTMNKMIHGSSVAFKAEDQEGKGKGCGGKGRGRGRGGRRFFKKKKGRYQEDHTQSDDWSWQTEEARWWQDGWSSQPDAADSWQSWDQESAHEHAESYKSKGKGKRKVRRVRRVKMVKTRKAVLM